jgi:hypothetical protein
MDSISGMCLVGSPCLRRGCRRADRHLAGFPDPFAVATINGEQTKTTTVSKRTLNPYWNESFDLCVPIYAIHSSGNVFY